MVALPFNSISPEILRVDGNISSNGIDDAIIETSRLLSRATILPSRIGLLVSMLRNE